MGEGKVVMTRNSKTASAPKRTAPPPKPVDNRDEMSVAELARGVLSKDIRPRIGDVRRLAEAALAGKKPKKDKKADGKKAKGKKLAKIPGQRAKK